MSDRRVLAISAACITAAIFLFLLSTYPSWKTAIGNGPIWPSVAPSTARVPEPTADKHSEAQVPARPTVQASSAATSTGEARPPVETATPPANAETMPSFDIVRVEPSGESVIAGRAKAGATVVLLDQGRPIAQAKADASGQVAFVPPTLAPGEHSLMLSLGAPATPGTLSSQSVAVSVPDRPKAPPMVALLQPDQPTRLLAGAVPATSAPAVSVGAIDVEEMGSIFATGRATPGSQCRIYLNGSFVAGVTAGPDGAWSLKIEHGMRPGHYAVRVDELASATGAVQARAEVPFDYPAQARALVSLLRPRKGQAALPVAPAPASEPQRPAAPASAQVASAVPAVLPVAGSGGGPLADASPTAGTTTLPAGGVAPVPAGATTIVSQLLTTRVVHGDSLWRISRKMLGHGRRYTQIYAANTTQIRDPRLIYPGQIFVMPQAAP